MNGATIEPWASTINPPIIIKVKIIGASHNFFLLDKKDNNSKIVFINPQY